uniref:Disease resistance protein RGA3 n=1 Tax=Cajanus cajan TaxID=3821 RepID=A0A151RF08_CAJCA|nr:Putative disease resistance protein RGA3 [Cajanus cajan]
MAESLLTAATESLIGKLASGVVKEASLMVGVHHDLQQMKETMVLIKAFLLDAEQKKPHNNALREWLKQIKRVISDADNIVDDFECEALRRHVVKTYGSFTRKVCRFFSTSNHLIYRFRMAHEIKDIKERLNKVAVDGHMFGLQMIHNDTRVVHVREMTHSHLDPSNVIGREHDKQKIIKLLRQDGHDKRLSVIPIVGMGGLGKTTLAKLVFNDTTIDECFPLKIWVCVSNDFELRNVLIKILNSAPNPTEKKFENFEMEQLQNHLRKTLQHQKFLLVLDDVWNENRTKWDELKEIIDVGVEGSKILVTTRSHLTAAMMRTKPSNSYLLDRLSEEDSFSLFVNLAFEKGEEKKYPQLLEIGKEIVRKCEGVPLAVRTLDILPALEISYDRLPSYLKPCFASFSIFPEAQSIVTIHCVNMWQALDLVPPPKERQTINDVVNQFLRELLLRSFLSDFVDLGTVYEFKLHDLVRDLALYVAKGEFQIINRSSPKIDEHVQHLRFTDNNLLDQDLVPTGLKLSIFPMKATNEAFLNTLVSRCKYLRFLELSFSEYKSLPSSIGKLKHLRYLCLGRNEKLKELPNAVCNLQCLKTFNFEGCIKLQEVPTGIRKLISLRQLYITTRQPDFPENEIANLTSLEDLRFFACDKLESFSEGIKLSSLKTLGICDCRNLKSLSFHVVTNLEVFGIANCGKLDLSMGLDNQIPSSCLNLVNLINLPQLVTFPRWLQGSMNTLHCLEIIDCENLMELPEWISTLICLKIIRISNCPKLLSFPDNMQHVTSLEHLEIKDCPELGKRCLRQDWYKISHIKKVIIHEPEE